MNLEQMNNAVNASETLNWDVFVTPGIPMVTSNLPPGAQQGMWQWASIKSFILFAQPQAAWVDAWNTIVPLRPKPLMHCVTWLRAAPSAEAS